MDGCICVCVPIHLTQPIEIYGRVNIAFTQPLNTRHNLMHLNLGKGVIFYLFILPYKQLILRNQTRKKNYIKGNLKIVHGIFIQSGSRFGSHDHSF